MKKTVFFDGYCGLCDWSVQLLLRLDQGKRVLRFAPLQGETAKVLLQQTLLEQLSPETVIFQDGEKIYIKSEAAIRVLMALGGLWKLASLFLIVPRRLRDPIYEWVARNRYRWFRRLDTCRIPTQEERPYFLP